MEAQAWYPVTVTPAPSVDGDDVGTWLVKATFPDPGGYRVMFTDLQNVYQQVLVRTAAHAGACSRFGCAKNAGPRPRHHVLEVEPHTTMPRLFCT